MQTFEIRRPCGDGCTEAVAVVAGLDARDALARFALTLAEAVATVVLGDELHARLTLDSDPVIFTATPEAS